MSPPYCFILLSISAIPSWIIYLSTDKNGNTRILADVENTNKTATGIKYITVSIKDKAGKDLLEQRRYLINFVNEGVNGLRHSKESFEDAIRACDAYEEYVKENNVHNGVINSTISAIREKYREHLILADLPSEDSYFSNTNGGN